MRRALAILACVWALWASGCGKGQSEPPSQKEVIEFHAALKDGDAMIVDRLLSAKPALADAKDESGQTPLKIAVQSGNEELAGVIRKHGGKE